jgi:outer membrane protein
MVLFLAVAVVADPLTLERVLELTALHHEAPRIAQAQLERAEAVRRMAYAKLLPELSLAGTYMRQPERTLDFGPIAYTIQEPTVTSARAAFDLTLLEARNFLVLSRAEPEFETVTAQARALTRAALFSSARAFLAVLSAEHVRDAARQRVLIAQRARDDAQKRFAHGRAALNDITRAELEHTSAEAAATDADAAVQQWRVELERFVGAPVTGALAEPLALMSAPIATLDPALAEAREKRPDLVALRSAAEAARRAAREPLWTLLPTLSLTGAYTVSSEGGLSGEKDNWGLGLTARWVPFDRGMRHFEASEKAAVATEARLTLERALADAHTDLARRLLQIQRAIENRDRSEALAGLSAKNVEEVSVRYKEGLTSAFELAYANGQLFTAQTDLARARLDVGLATLSFREASGIDVLELRQR